MEGADHGLFVAAGGFANDLRGGMVAQKFEQAGVPRRVVGEGVRLTGQIELQGGLGHVEADLEDGRVVLTHTCMDTSPASGWPACSGNGSSLEQ